MRFRLISALSLEYFMFFLLKSTNFLCIVKVDRHCFPPTVFVGHLTIGAIPVFFNPVFLFLGFFCAFLSQNCEEPKKITKPHLSTAALAKVEGFTSRFYVNKSSSLKPKVFFTSSPKPEALLVKSLLSVACEDVPLTLLL